jgi:hypothetical protein
MKYTLRMNPMKHVHVWRGVVTPVEIDMCNYAVPDIDIDPYSGATTLVYKEADWYYQYPDEIADLMGRLSEDERLDLDKGWTIVTENWRNDDYET